MYISKKCILFISVGFLKLKELAKRAVINSVANRQSLHQLSLPRSIIEELLQEYSAKLIIKPISLSISDKAAAPFMLLEYNLRFGVTYSKTFLGIVKNNNWIRDLFRTVDCEWHFILIYYTHLKSQNEVSYLKACPICFPTCHKKDEKYLNYYRHVALYQRNSNLFDLLIDDENWCSVCRQVPLYELLTEYECNYKYGRGIHTCCENGFMECWNCARGRRLLKLWYKKI